MVPESLAGDWREDEMAGKLKALTVEKLKPGRHGDGAGLYLHVQDSGSRSWILRTMVCGKRCEVGLGGIGNRSLSEARDEAGRLRSLARKGVDILAARREERQAVQRENNLPTFEGAALAVHATLSETFESETHSYNWLQSLKTYVFPVFGNKTVDKVDSADVLSAIGPIWTEKPDTAGRTLRRIKAVFDYCIVKGHRTVTVNGMPVTMPNPCDAIRMALPKQNKKENHHEALPYSELSAFITSLQKTNSAVIVKLAFEFLILTAARTGEVLNARWDEIDFDKRVWIIPAARMKMKTAHEVPLSARCIEILKLAKQFNDAEIVFPGRNAGHPLSQMAFLMVLRRLGREDITAHGFRATFKTWAEERTKSDHLVIEASMAHAVKGIERHYLRTTFFEQRRKLMDSWSRFAAGTPAAKTARRKR